MKLKKILLLLMLPLAFLFLKQVLGGTDPAAEQVFRYSYPSGDIESLDPSLTSEPYAIQLIDEVTIGLYRLNEASGELEPGMVQSREVSADGMTYVFELLPDIPWVRWDAEKGEVVPVTDCAGSTRVVTAEDFVYGIERTLRPETASPYAFLLNDILVNAAAYNQGKAEDFSQVGIRALDAAHLEVQFREPNAYNLNILSLWMARAQPRWLIEGDECSAALADGWIESGNFQGYGPFTLKDWQHDASLTLIRNPFWSGTAAVPQAFLDEVSVRMISETAALAEYESGALDQAVIPMGDFDRIMNDPATEAQRMLKTLNVGTEAILFNIHLAPTDDWRVRKALALAIERNAVVAAVKTGRLASGWIHPAVEGGSAIPKGAFSSLEYDPEEAKRLMDDYCAEMGIEPADLAVTYSFSTSDLHQLRAQVIAAMWETVLGIRVNLISSEWTVFNQQRKEGLANVYRTAWIQDYPDANNFTADVFLCPGGYYQSSSDWPTVDCAKTDDGTSLYYDYADLVTRAAKETDPEERRALYFESERILMDGEVLLLPLSYNDGWILRNPKFAAPVSAIGYERFEKWRVED